jgi:nitrogen fixation NifU-like protein
VADSLLDDLYKEILLDHYRNPRNHGHIEEPSCSADGANPLCGDEITVELMLDGDDIAEIQFSGQGCSISQASASMMTDYVKGRDREAAEEAIGIFQQMMTSGEAPDAEGFDDIEALIGVAKFPVRVKCASLGWKTLEQALKDGANGAAQPVTTDDRSMSDG